MKRKSQCVSAEENEMEEPAGKGESRERDQRAAFLGTAVKEDLTEGWLLRKFSWRNQPLETLSVLTGYSWATGRAMLCHLTGNEGHRI